MASVAATSVSDDAERGGSQPLIGRGMTVLFIALIGCFAAGGTAADMTTPMAAGFKRILALGVFAFHPAPRKRGLKRGRRFRDPTSG